MYLTSRRWPNPKYLSSRPQVTSGERQRLVSPHAGDDSTKPCLASPPHRLGTANRNQASVSMDKGLANENR
ncbi:hypothetical protein V8C40DRAFT_118415 [Trichoderma camerunense]